MTRESNKPALRLWALVLAPLGAFMVALDATVVSTALSTIYRDLGASIEELEWTVNAYTLSFAVLLMTGAALGDRFGRRRLFVVGLGLFIVASAACALASDVKWLIVARAVQGSGAALVAPLALTLLSAAFPSEQRGRALGIYSGVMGLAILSGPVVGGAIAGGLAWQWIFWLNVPIGLLVIPFVLARLQESFGPRTPLDIGGLLSISGAALGIVWGLIRGNSAGWSSFEVVASLIAGALLVVVFVVWERRVRVPMVPMRFFRSRAFSAGNIASFLLTASTIGSLFFLAQFLQAAQGYKPLDAGLRLLTWTATMFIVSPIAGMLINRMSERPLIITGLLLQALGMGWIGLIASPSLPYLTLVTPLIIAGSGISMALPAAQSVVMSAVPTSEVGKASGTYNMLRQLGGAFGVAVLSAVFAGLGSFGSPQTFSDGFVPAIAVSAALATGGAIFGLFLPRRRQQALAPVKGEVRESPLADMSDRR